MSVFFRRFLLLALPLIWGGAFWLSAPSSASAQIRSADLTAASQATGLPSTDPRVIAVRIINIALGLLATIMVAIMVYSGFEWMIAGGEKTSVDKAKTRIRNAIIGLILILSSWAITVFVVNKLLGAGEGGGGGISSQQGGGGGGGFGGGGSTDFQIRSMTPIGSVSLRNIEVRIIFSRAVDSVSASTTIQVIRLSDNAPVSGSLLVSDTVVRFVPLALCPAPNIDRYCFEGNTDFAIRVLPGLRSISNQPISCGGLAPVCEGRFRTGNLVDTASPAVFISRPFEGQSVPRDDLVRVISQASDDSGIAYIETLADGVSAGIDTPSTTPTPRIFEGSIEWDTSGLATGTHVLQSFAHDVDSNVGTGTVRVIVRAQHCFNAAKDADEAGVDCGGSDCGACPNSQCVNGGQCSTGVCTNGICVVQPIITDFQQRHGKPGSFVSIFGANFGSRPGSVKFTPGVQAASPEQCAVSSLRTWTPSYVLVAVPTGTQTGAIGLTNLESSLSDNTGNDTGLRADFTVDETSYPGLCAADPFHGKVGDQVRLMGTGFGNTSDKVEFGDYGINAFLAWSDKEVRLNVPVVTPATYAVKVRVTSTSSNAVPYTVDEKVPVGAPVISSLDPPQGPIGQYVTLLGKDFGGQVGTVKFKDREGNEGIADVNFPAACGNRFWEDQTIVVKVPKTLNARLGSVSVEPAKGPYTVSVVRQDGVRSSGLPFTVNTEALAPGLCSVRPSAGPLGTSVTLRGERFGTASDQVMFRSAIQGGSVQAQMKSAKAGELEVLVPAGAITGFVQVFNAERVASNKANFIVQNCKSSPEICGAGQVCCADGSCTDKAGECSGVSATLKQYAWRTSTGPIPLNPRVVEECVVPPTLEPPTPPSSPSPWEGREGGKAVCVNAEVVVRFNTVVTNASITPQNVLVRRCMGASPNPCTETVAVRGVLALSAVDDGSSFLVFRPDGGLWQASSTYQVILRKDIRSVSGIPMIEDAARCGTGNGYCFRFQTRGDDLPCKIGFVTVSPHPFTANRLGQTIPYRANALAANDFCVQLNGAALNWTWFTGTSLAAPDGRAAITNPNPDPPGRNLATGTALAETGPLAVKINAQVLNPDGKTVRGIADLYTRLQPPQIEAFGPSCDQACQNAAIWVRFNTAMDPGRTHPSQIIIKRCTNENCRAFDAVLETSQSPTRLSLAPGAAVNAPLNYFVFEPSCTDGAGQVITCFEAGRFYKVIVKGGANSFVSSYGRLPLVGLNDPEGFAWTFRVKQTDARCAVSKILVTPGEKFETVVGARQAFHAQPIGADACGSAEQPLVSDQSYQWTSSDRDVATFYANGALDTTRNLPSHCGPTCLLTGADGPHGLVADCGDNMVETTDDRYCKGAGGALCKPGDGGCATPFGDRCKVLPKGSKGGEECDHGANNGQTDLCGTTCLWNPMSGATCGNNVVDQGEQCDPGKHCTSGSALGRACVVNADCGKDLQGKDGVCSIVEDQGCSATCQFLGSRAAGSICGNGSVGDGEACDDGNNLSGDGCSSDCLREGSVRVVARCGNGIIEPGEACEAKNGVWPDGCNQAACLHVGMRTLCGNPNDKNCCGNGDRTEAGKDCDYGYGNNGEGKGCSSICLLEGASMKYAAPSFCGDGALGTGEQCEALSQGDGLVDPIQLAEITGTRQPDANGRMSSALRAVYDTKSGQATYGLQCGFTQEASCPNGYGLTAGGCCAPRPVASPLFPSSNAKDVCRNTLIAGAFNILMDKGSFTNNAFLAKEYSPQVYPKGCPAGTAPLENVPLAIHGWRGWAAGLWQRMLDWFSVRGANAAPWCVGSTPIALSFEETAVGGRPVTRVTFGLNDVLEPRAKYRVVFRGDPDMNDAVKRGVKSSFGVVNQADPANADSGILTWSFTTGDSVCLADDILIEDTVTSTTPYFFTKASENHVFRATVVSRQNGTLAPLSAVPNVYDWQWDPWMSSDDTVVSTTEIRHTATVSEANVTAQPKNGSPFITARIRVTADTINTPPTLNSLVSANTSVNVLLCENPWPDRSLGFFTDAIGSASLQRLAPIFANGSVFYNFSLAYCRDAGSATTTVDDLPALIPKPVPLSTFDLSRGILRQYFFTFQENRLRGDGIGIRIADNPLHLSPSAWYEAQGFRGSPQALAVDGYEAVKDGNTIYVAATNLEAAGFGSVSSTIYILSRNPDAQPETVAIFDQLLKNWVFNVNLARDSQNVCVYAGAKGGRVNGDYYFYQDPKTKASVPIRCTADWECAKYDLALECASLKAKLERDTKRIADFQLMLEKLEVARAKSGVYPTIAAGSFLQTITNSRWPSWQTGLSSAGGFVPPQDPVNKWLSCGFCQAVPTTPCMANSDCGVSDICIPSQGFDPSTCWNASSTQFQCAKLVDGTTNHKTVSRIYQYRSMDGGRRYQLSTELEGVDPSRYSPPLPVEARVCSNMGQTCFANKDCEKRDAGGALISSGTCNGTGGRWLYTNTCSGTPIGRSGICGDGVLDMNAEVCELGQTAPAPCVTADKKQGTKIQICSDCQRFIDGPASACVANAVCGNGRVDAGEACDDGALNGTYGHCNRVCTAIGAICGDSQLSLGEKCDNGIGASVRQGFAPNGAYCGPGCNVANSCNVECSGLAPYCGDGIIQAPEICDGGIEQTTKAICQGGANAEQPCSIGGDCPGGTCGGADLRYRSCENVAISVCSNDANVACTFQTEAKDCGAGNRCISYPTQRSRTCLAPGDARACEWPAAPSWSVCLRKGSCGDGVIDPREECDDGAKNSDQGSCTKACKRNVCGDGRLYSVKDGGLEECDYGAARNTGQCLSQADYASSCVGCSPSCHFITASGGYCGDGFKNGPEQCDGSDVPATTCQTLGFDYAASTTLAGADAIGCTNKCTLTGCRLCQDEPGAGVISAQVFDAVYSNQPVPGARATLYLRGMKVGETATDMDGKFSFNTLNTRTECSKYRLIIDFSKDNPCTADANRPLCNGAPALRKVDAALAAFGGAPNYDEGRYSGYWPYEIQNFNSQTFAQFTSQGKIYLAPRVGPDETLVIFSWNRDISSRPIDAYLLIPPPGYAYCVWGEGGCRPPLPNSCSALDGEPYDANGWPTSEGRVSACKDPKHYVRYSCADSADPANCVGTRTVSRADNSMRYLYDLNIVPHANLHCFDANGKEVSGCDGASMSVQTVRYKRGTWNPFGRYSLYLVDRNAWADPMLYYQSVSSTVRVVTERQIFTVAPPLSFTAENLPQGTCKNKNAPLGRYWLPFQQDAASGRILIQNQFLCEGDATPGENPATGLPKPL